MNTPAAVFDPRPFIPIKVDGKFYSALIDTGSTKTYVGSALRQEFKLLQLPMKEQEMSIHMANSSEVITKENYTVTLYLDDIEFTGIMTYLPELNEDAIIGMDLLGESGLKIFMEGRLVAGRKPPVAAEADFTEAEPEKPSSTSTEYEDNVVVPSYSGMLKRSENNAPKMQKDPFQGITLKGRRHHRMFYIYRPWGKICVRMNKKGDKATLKWKQMMKTINLSK